MGQKLIVGINFLHTHPEFERQIGFDEHHVIVDKNDLEAVHRFFMEYPEMLDNIKQK